jgi:serine phosphatase RsbU (regulator of sigma subunit)
MSTEIQSKAFKQAVLFSERIRIVGLLCTLFVLLLVILVRFLALGSQQQKEFLPKVIILMAFYIAYEFIMLMIVNRLIKTERDLPSWAWGVNLFIELLLPTIGLLMLTGSSFMGPYRALIAPAMLLYFLFIILSTLRLNPALSCFTGIFATLGFLTVLFYTYRQYPNPAPNQDVFSLPVYLTHAVMILIGGFIAGAVAREIRKHVTAALREAETRRKVELMERDLNIARSIQQGLLPEHSPELEGFEIAGWSQPADQTGGDYYDWQQLPDGRIAISLADVTGHGIGPALVTAVCRAYSRASFPTGEETGVILDRINELLVEDLSSERFVTFVVALFDPTKSNIHLLSAGHGPLLLYTAADDQVQNFNAHDIPLGIAADIGYGPAQEIELAPGDIVVLITDGFFEWTNTNGEQFGLARLRKAVRAAKDLPAQEIISRLYDEVIKFSDGTKQQDDLTAVIIKRIIVR